MNTNLSKMIKLAMLSALGVLFMVTIKFPIIPSAPFLIYEPGDVPALIAAFLFGPAAGFTVIVIISVIQGLFFSADGWVGALMHIVASGTMVFVAGHIYKRFHSARGAVIALVAGTLSMTLIMIPLNLTITPWYYGMPVKAVIPMLPTAIIPFNLVKAGINSIITAAVYKSVGKVLRAEAKKLAKEV